MSSGEFARASGLTRKALNAPITVKIDHQPLSVPMSAAGRGHSPWDMTP